MDRQPIEDLLQPSLRSRQFLLPPYSVRAGFFVAFFGGLFAAVIFGAINSRRADRLERDVAVLGLLACVGAGITTWMSYADVTHSMPGFIEALGGERHGVRLFGRGLGILGFGLIYLLQRDMHVARELRGQDAPSAWAPGILSGIAALVLSLGFALVGASIAKL
jgi:hypothetical protein